MNNREAFEAWYKSELDKHASFARMPSGYCSDYVDTRTDYSWEAWQAALASHAQQSTNIRQIVKNAIISNSHPAEDWHLAFNDAEEIDIVANQVAIALHNDFGDPYQGAREDLAIWKKRALEAESNLQSQDRQESREIQVPRILRWYKINELRNAWDYLTLTKPVPEGINHPKGFILTKQDIDRELSRRMDSYKQPRLPPAPDGGDK